MTGPAAVDSQLLIVVNERNEALRAESRAACHAGDGILHRAFSVYLFDRRGRLLIQRRSGAKQLWPGYWANSCCSHPRWGEELEEAAPRRLREELGIRVERPLRRFFDFQYAARFDARGSENELCSVFVGSAEAVGRVDPDEVAEWEFVAPDDLDRRLATQPDAYTPWLHQGWRILRDEHWPDVRAWLEPGRLGAPPPG